MSEKLYKIVSGVGAGSIALGIITLVTGVSTGILRGGLKGNEDFNSPYGNPAVRHLYNLSCLFSVLFRGKAGGA